MGSATAFALALILTFIKAQDSSDAVTFLNSINKFSSRSYQEIANSKGSDSIIYSGVSVSTAFAFLSAGARGNTQKELITTALGFPSQSFAESAFKSGLTRINNVKGLTLHIANKAYVADLPGLELSSNFKQKAVDVFRSEIEKINFSQAQNAIATINAWAAMKTNQKIKEALPKNSVGDGTRLVLVNAIYFKGTWDKEFDVKETRKADFNQNLNKKIQVNMMQATGSYGLYEHNEWDANFVELPYKGKEASMVIILPNKIDGLADVEKKIAASNLKNDVFDVITFTKIDLQVPKFLIETSIELNDVMQKLGATSIFDGSGDLGGLLSTSESLTVTKAIQKAFIEVNEEGTEAAAVTSIVVGITSAMPHPSIVCDRPFMYYIKLSTGEVLFMGRYTGVAATSPDTIPGGGTPVTTTTEKPITPNPTNGGLFRPCRSYPPWARPPRCRRFPLPSPPLSYRGCAPKK